MKNLSFSIILTAAITTLFLACSPPGDKKTSQSEQVVDQTKSSAALWLPAFKMRDLKGNVVDIKSFSGKKVFVNLWASWCPPCKAEIPSIEALSRKLDAQKVAFVMLSLDDDFNDARQYAGENKMQLPIYAAAENLPAIFQTDAIPATFIFNEQGKLISQHNGMADYNTDAFAELMR